MACIWSPSDPCSRPTSSPKTTADGSPFRSARNPDTNDRSSLSGPSTAITCQFPMRTSLEEDPRHEQERRDETRQAVAEDVAEERGHGHPRLLGDRLHHEVRC